MVNAVAENVTGTIGTVLVSLIMSHPLRLLLLTVFFVSRSGVSNSSPKVSRATLVRVHCSRSDFVPAVYLNHKRRTTAGLHVAL